LGVGPVLSHKGFREAVWSFDILRHNLPDLQLVLVGPGRDRPQVAEFVKWLQISPWVRLVGEVETVRPWLEAADLVWVPSLRPGGVCAALEAMAAGKPVLASRLPGLAEVVADQETGILVRPGDKAALARQSRRLLQDDSLRLQMGEAARKRARDLFGLDRLREEATHLYGHLGALDRR
jgi:glycosyltransferase involved in cell wall biosynthesis